MAARDYKDIAGGGLLVLAGSAFAYHAIANLVLGTLRRIGPGMFPAGLGVILALFGLAILIPALFRQGAFPRIDLRTPVFVLGGVSAFALTIVPFGLIPAIVAVTVISSLAEPRFRPVSLALLCGVLCLMAWLTFRVGLGLPFQMLRWPF